jgi:hypothetical protein
MALSITTWKVGIKVLTVSFNIKYFISLSNLICRSQNQGTYIGISDINLSGLITDWSDNGTYFNVQMSVDSFGNFPNLLSELTQNANGSYDNIVVTDGIYTYTFVDVHDITPTTFKCLSITGLSLPNSSPLIPNGTRNYTLVMNGYFPLFLEENPFNFNPIYLGGGYGAYSSITDGISFASISNQINSGNPEVRYINVTSTGEIQFDRYTINVIKPDYPVTSTYLKREALEKTASDLQVNSQILGYRLTALDRTSISQISRYRGPYNPKWKDVIKFIDTQDLLNENLIYYNIQILTDVGYLIDSGMAKIPYIYYNKVNVENPNIILGNSLARSGNSERFIYPLIGDIAIDFDSYFIFKSNWDINYYKKYLTKTDKISVIGTREPKEEKSFFGSKAISIPNEIRIETFPTGIITDEQLREIGSINNTDANIVEKTVQTQRLTELILNFYITKSLQDWLITDGFGSEFYKYVNINYSFGDIGLDDDIKTYITENIFERYAIKEIIMWEKIWDPIRGQSNPSQIVTNLTDVQKLANGYVKSKSYRVVFDTTGGLNFQMIYTIPRDKKTSISFTVILGKK